ncbi:MAG: hypothetical protein NC098_04340 [Lachnoclostridium sp.]|nr:hypothetical protein [Lachnoclostridium sp.]
MKQHILLTISIAASLLSACRGGDNTRDEAQAVVINRLDLAAIEGDTSAISSLEPGASVWAGITIGPDTGARELAMKASDKPYNDDVVTQWANTDSLSKALGGLYGRFTSLIGEDAPAVTYAVASPFNQSVVTADSLIFIALNHYLGPEKEYYAYFPEYQRRNKSTDRIGIDVATALVRAAEPYQPAGQFPTALSRMTYEGAVVEAIMRISGKTEQQVLGYDDEEYAWLRANEQEAWRSMLSRDMVFSTALEVVEGLVRQAAVTSVLHYESPGAAGRYIGHHIVESYLNTHPDTDLRLLLSPEFYDSETLLSSAGYEPK